MCKETQQSDNQIFIKELMLEIFNKAMECIDSKAELASQKVHEKHDNNKALLNYPIDMRAALS